MNNADALLREAADMIDALDEEIASINDRKKDVYGNIRETIAAPEFRAWKEAVKLRRKRVSDRDALEAHDERVWRLLSMLERVLPQPEQKTAVDPVSAPANSPSEKEAPMRAPRAPARAAEIHIQPKPEISPYHDPVTGEILSADDPGEIPSGLRRSAA